MVYTTNQLHKIFGYKNRKSFLKALYENQKKGGKNTILSNIWRHRIRVGKKWLFSEEVLILKTSGGGSGGGVNTVVVEVQGSGSSGGYSKSGYAATSSGDDKDMRGKNGE